MHLNVYMNWFCSDIMIATTEGCILMLGHRGARKQEYLHLLSHNVLNQFEWILMYWWDLQFWWTLCPFFVWSVCKGEKSTWVISSTLTYAFFFFFFFFLHSDQFLSHVMGWCLADNEDYWAVHFYTSVNGLDLHSRWMRNQKLPWTCSCKFFVQLW